VLVARGIQTKPVEIPKPTATPTPVQSPKPMSQVKQETLRQKYERLLKSDT
jgi:hypothetical protein